MSNNFHAMLGYKTVQREFTSSQGIELKVFAKITSALKVVDVDKIGGMPELAEALVQNSKLWNILFIDLINPKNELPLDLKTNLISLAEFTQAHTIKVLSANADHQVLIDINQSVIEGLRQREAVKKANEPLQTEAA